MTMKAKAPPFPEDAVLTFADYFKLDAPIDDVLREFDVTFQLKSCDLPRRAVDQSIVDDLKQRFQRTLPQVDLSSEMARREFLIAPVVTEAAALSKSRVRVEFPIKVDDRLQGKVDYFVLAQNQVPSQHRVLIVEAKNGDLERAFKQLAVELIALDRWLDDSDDNLLYGAVSIGNVWQFGILDRSAKAFTQDINTYSVPTDVQDVIGFLYAILTT